MCSGVGTTTHPPQQKKAKHKLIHSVNPRRGGGNLELHAWHLPFNPTFTPFTIKLSPFLSNSFLFFFFLLLWSEEPSLPLLCPMGSLPPIPYGILPPSFYSNGYFQRGSFMSFLRTKSCTSPFPPSFAFFEFVLSLFW